VGIADVLSSSTLPIMVYVKESAKEHLCISLPGVCAGCQPVPPKVVVSDALCALCEPCVAAEMA
jgi:hypothetical protein